MASIQYLLIATSAVVLMMMVHQGERIVQLESNDDFPFCKNSLNVQQSSANHFSQMHISISPSHRGDNQMTQVIRSDVMQ